MSDTILPVESEPIPLASPRRLWAARVCASLYAISLVGEYVGQAHFDLLNPLLLVTLGPRILLGLVLLYFLFRSSKKLAFALGLGVATAFIALFGVASNVLLSPLGRTFNLSLALIIFVPVTPPFVEMMHQPNPQLATQGLLLFWSFGACSAMLGLSSLLTFRKMAHETNELPRLRFAFRAGIFCPLVVWLIFMLLVFLWLAVSGGIHI